MRSLRPVVASLAAVGTLLSGVGPAAASANASPAATDRLGTVNATLTVKDQP